MKSFLTPHNIPSYEKLGINEKPFELIPDYRFLYLPKKRIIVLDKIIELVESRASHIIVNGENGSGKTSIAKRVEFIINTYQNHYPLYINTKNYLHKRDFWKMLVAYFGLPVMEKPENNRKNLCDYLNKNQDNIFFDLIIDRAELLAPDTINALVELDEIRNKGINPVQLILFRTFQERPINFGFTTQNINLEPFDLDEIRKMIEYRLFISGSTQIFSETAIEKLYEISGGNPSKVVNWCRSSLEFILQNGKTFIDDIDIEGIRQFTIYSPLQ